VANGTIKVSKNSTAINGTDTSFTSELSAGDFIVFTVDEVAYTLAVESIESDTALTLATRYTGPVEDGLGWQAVPRKTMSQVTIEIVSQVTEALRGLNADKKNWQAVFSGDESITVTLPDGTPWTGPSWNYLQGKLDEANTAISEGVLQKVNNLSDVADVAQAQKNLLNSARLRYSFDSETGFDTFATVTPGVANPETGAEVKGGMLQSAYANEENQVVNAAGFLVQNFVGSTPAAQIGVANWSSENGGLLWKHWDFNYNGKVTFPSGSYTSFSGVKPGMYTQGFSLSPIQIDINDASNTTTQFAPLIAGRGKTAGLGYYGGAAFGVFYTGGSNFPSPSIFGATHDYAAGTGTWDTGITWMFNVNNGYGGMAPGDINTTSGIIKPTPAADARIKTPIRLLATESALSKIEQMKFHEYTLDTDESARTERGLFGQELEEIDPYYVMRCPDITKGRECDDRYYPNQYALLIDALAAVQELSKKVSALEAANEELLKQAS